MKAINTDLIHEAVSEFGVVHGAVDETTAVIDSIFL